MIFSSMGAVMEFTPWDSRRLRAATLKRVAVASAARLELPLLGSISAGLMMELFLSLLSTMLSLLVLLFIVMMMWSLLLLLLLLLLLSMFVVTTRGAPNYNLLRHDKRRQEKSRDCQKLSTHYLYYSTVCSITEYSIDYFVQYENYMYCCTVPETGDHGLEVWELRFFKFLSISRIKYKFEILKQYSL